VSNSTFACAHRGDSGVFRENTTLSIQSAITAGAQIVEIDVRMTSDGQIVVLHDPTLERMWGVSTLVKEMSWAQIQKLGTSDQRIPLLSQVLSLFVGTTATLMIDMDSLIPATAAYEITLKSALDSTQICWCGNLQALEQIRSLSSDARIWMPWNKSELPTPVEISKLNPEFINQHYSFATARSVREIHRMGRKVSLWTIDDEATMRWAINIGVDSITSNQLQLLQENCKSVPSLIGAKESNIDEIDVDRAMLVARDLGKWAIMVASSMDPGEISLKENPADIVTEIDVLIETHVREVIAANFPGHNFVGEELGGVFEADTPSWYLDPIDGTTNFANRMPWSSFSLALAFNRTPLIGVVIDPWRNSLFEAQAGKGAHLNGGPIQVEVQNEVANPLASRIVSTELASYQPWPGMLGLLDELAKNFCTMRIMGSGTLTLTGVAAGRGVGAVIGRYSPIDHLAAAIIVHEAGGAVWDESGEVNLFPLNGGIMCATPAAAPMLYELWKKSIS
jgi:myo-inositol-1(or 4)-monophosphatase